MDLKPFSYKKILIVGDSGRGKTTFAHNLSSITGIPYHSTDDYFWKVKYTEPNDREKSVEEISKIYDEPQWIMEGTTRRLILKGLEQSEIIFYLKHKNIFTQYISIIKRWATREEERLLDLLTLLRHVTYKKYKKGYGDHMPHLEELLQPFKDKLVNVESFKEIDRIIENIK